jgi:dihydrolipoamide dehydrogenase
MAAAFTHDLIVIGSGPGGYVAANRAAELGLRVACVERESRLGGVCLRVGCIPSKALLDSSEHYALARQSLGDHGVRVKDLELDLPAMMERKDRVVRTLTDGVRTLLERRRVEVVLGTGRLTGEHAVEVSGADGASRTLSAPSILLATGSEPLPLPSIPLDGERIVSSTEALSFAAVPEHLGVVGGGYIGLELGSVWARLGARVTVLEALPTIAATLDGQTRRYLERTLKKQGIAIRVGAGVEAAAVHGDHVRVRLASEPGQAAEELVCDRLLVAAGRRPLTAGLGLETGDIRTDPQTGRIQVDPDYRTSTPSIAAIGDLVNGPMLAHKASAEGVAVVERMAGIPSTVNYGALPSVVYTWPEVASVGKTEEQLKAEGATYRSGTYPFSGVGRAVCLGETQGFVKILADERTDRVLGVHIIGPRASDLIAEAVLTLEFGGSVEDLQRTVHAHPTLSEGLLEAARGIGANR